MIIQLSRSAACQSIRLASGVPSPQHLSALRNIIVEVVNKERTCYFGTSSSLSVNYFGTNGSINNRNRRSTRSWNNMSTMTDRPVIHPTIESMRSVRKLLDPSISVGFVPTMGALHEGMHIDPSCIFWESCVQTIFNIIYMYVIIVQFYF